jgi:hypothetical protein
MRRSRIFLIGGILVVLFVLLITLSAVGHNSAITPLLTIVVLAGLIGGGNLLYGKNSHGAKAQARIRPAQEAQNRAIDEARRAAAAATQTANPPPPTPTSPPPHP